MLTYIHTYIHTTNRLRKRLFCDKTYTQQCTSCAHQGCLSPRSDHDEGQRRGGDSRKGIAAPPGDPFAQPGTADEQDGPLLPQAARDTKDAKNSGGESSYAFVGVDEPGVAFAHLVYRAPRVGRGIFAFEGRFLGCWGQGCGHTLAGSAMDGECEHEREGRKGRDSVPLAGTRLNPKP